FFSCLLPPASCLLAAQRPNVVIFLADDQGWGDLSIHGNSNLATPNIDSLAAEGALFERFFVCPVCAPTRAEFLTGRFYARTGVRGVSTGQERLNADEITIADTFKKAGYATGAFGKWHNGSQHPYHPNARGFDEYYGFTSGHWGHYFDTMIEHNGEITRGKGYITDDLTTHAMKFIEKNAEAGKPFFCYIPYNTPHSPMQVPDKFFEKFAENPLAMHNRDPGKEELPHVRAALAMCENIDWNVGRVLGQLEQLELADDTIVVYFSDNGPNGWRWNGDMKGRKGAIDEGGVRVPFLIRWPGQIEGGTKVDRIAGAIDLLPTLADLAGVPLISEKPLDGLSIRPLLEGNASGWPDRPIISYRPSYGRKRKGGPALSVRNQRYRLDTEGALFDLEQDPGQRTDVASRHRDIVANLEKVGAKFNREIASEVTPDVRPFPVGEGALTHLPARDGIEHGNTTRSARAPNCSYFTDLKTAEDTVTWDVEVTTPGTFEVLLYHSIASENVGCEMTLDFAGSSLAYTFTQAHDPPLYGMKEDRTEGRGS
ncbi:MAG: arylsulfatase, partial [Verrucomicrobiales bacterium]